MKLDSTQIQFYSSMEDTFRTPGWALLSQGWTEEQASLSDIVFFNAKSMEDVQTARVRFGLLNELINIPKTIQAQRDQIESMDEDPDV